MYIIIIIILVKPLKLCLLSGHDLTTVCLMYQFNKEEASKKWPSYSDNVYILFYYLLDWSEIVQR